MNMRRILAARICAIADRRPPDFVIGGVENPYLRRWWAIPRNRWLNVYLHQFLRPDDDRALHDHPWLFNASWLLNGSYVEFTLNGKQLLSEHQWKFRRGAAPHRVMLHMDGGDYRPAWTLFITGPRVREWGFLCPRGWRHWKDFTNPADGGATIGRGCE